MIEEKPKRDFSVKFECTICHKPVKRVTKDCDTTNKLCSDCNTKDLEEHTNTVVDEVSTSISEVRSDPVIVAEKPVVLDTMKEVQRKLAHYRAILTETERLSVELPTENFYVLYDKARKRILGE